MVTKEKDDELALFLEMRRRDKEKERNMFLVLHDSDVLDAPPGNNAASSPISKFVSFLLPRKTAAERFLDSENEKSDYDWLITPPATPLFPSLEMEPLANQLRMSDVRPTALKSRLTNVLEEPASRTIVGSKHSNVPSGLNPSDADNRRPSTPTSTSRPATPTGQPSSTPTSTSRPATPTGQPILPTTANHSRPSTPTSLSILSCAKPVAPPVRSSTPSTTTACSSKATTKPSVLSSKSKSRSATPTRLPSTTTSAPGMAVPPARSSSVTKSASATSKNPVPSRGSSPTVKSRPRKPNEMPGFSLDVPPNLKTSLPDRPVSTTRTRPASATKSRPTSASRSRPGVVGAQSSSLEVDSKARNRRRSSSPARGRTSNGGLNSNRISVTVKSRTKTNGDDDVNPVRMGSKMVERVVNMRKLAPPKQDEHYAGKASSLDTLGFGRNISKKSLDMALRHMDIRRTIGGNLCPIITQIPASSIYSVRSGDSTKSSTLNVSDSPLATRSNASSEPSVNFNFVSDGNGIDFGYSDFGRERGYSSPGSQH